MIEGLGQNPQRKYLSLRHCLMGRGATGKHPRQFWNLGKPAAIVFALVFDSKVHGHLRDGHCTPIGFLPPTLEITAPRKPAKPAVAGPVHRYPRGGFLCLSLVVGPGSHTPFSLKHKVRVVVWGRQTFMHPPHRPVHGRT